MRPIPGRIFSAALVLALLALLAAGSACRGTEELAVEYGPYELDSNRLMLMPVSRQPLKLPKDHNITAIKMVTQDGDGRELAGEYICHNNFGPAIVFEHWGPFDHGRKVLLDGYTQEVRLPAPFAIGLQSEDFLLEMMYNNPTSGRIEGVKTRLSVEFAPAGERDVVLYPQMMSVFEQPDDVWPGHWGYYVEAKSEDRKRRLFDVANDLTIHHCSFHLHEHARRIHLRNVTTEETICDVKPEYRDHKMVRVPQVSLPEGVTVHKQDVLEVIVDYENPLDKPIDTMGAAIVFGRCPNAAPDCLGIEERPADNEHFDANAYYALTGQERPSQHRHH